MAERRRLLDPIPFLIPFAFLALAACVAFLALPACVGPDPLTVKADRDLYKAIAPHHRKYVEADAALTPAEKTTRLRTLETWRIRIESQEAEVGR